MLTETEIERIREYNRRRKMIIIRESRGFTYQELQNLIDRDRDCERERMDLAFGKKHSDLPWASVCKWGNGRVKCT